MMQLSQPPKLAGRFLTWFCRPELLEEIQGDLYARYERDCKTGSKMKADIKYWVQVLNFIRPFALKRSKSINNTGMFKSHLKISFRNLSKHRSSSAINIIGLTIGLASFWLILHCVFFQKSFEDFNRATNQVYRLVLNSFEDGKLVSESSEVYPAIGPLMKESFPNTNSYARLLNMGDKNEVVIYRETSDQESIAIKQKRFMYADPTTLDILGRPMVMGDESKALSEPFSIVLSESMAKRYFGDENPLGHILRLRDDDMNNELCTVKGVFEDVPENTHIKFDALISLSTLHSRRNGPLASLWEWKQFYTYIKLKPGTDMVGLESKLSQLIETHKPDLKESGKAEVLQLQSLKDIHLTSHLSDEPEVNGSVISINYLFALALIILVIAWINYTNLTVSKVLERAKEAGVRKVMGSGKKQIILQFLTESMLTNGIAMVLALVLVVLVSPALEHFGGVPLAYKPWMQLWFWISVLGLFFLGGILSGIYPAIILSSTRPINAMRGKVILQYRGSFSRKFLISAQFSTGIMLIIATIVMFQQMRYIEGIDLGFDQQGVIVIKRPPIVDSNKGHVGNYFSFKNSLQAESTIVSISNTINLPGKKPKGRRAMWRQGHPESQTLFMTQLCDFDYMLQMEQQLLAGRVFSREVSSDQQNAIIINKTAMNRFGFDDPKSAVGSTVLSSVREIQREYTIIGVLEDYHFESLHEKIEPLIISVTEGRFVQDYILIKTASENFEATIAKIQEHWEKSFEGQPFDFFFLDDYLANNYQDEANFKNLFTAFTFLAIFISCLGLYGLMLFTTSRRSKEIGIRKVLGASISRLILLLAGDTVKYVLLANLIAWPLGYLFINRWLENFAYKIQPEWYVFIGAGSIVFILAVLTVSLQTFKTAVSNPVNSLRDE